MESTLILNFLWLIPLGTWMMTKNMISPYRSAVRGVTLGLVVSPASLGLYGFYFVGPVAAILGMLGLVLVQFHGMAGYELAVLFNIIQSNTVVANTDKISIEILSCIFWSLTYGFLGYLYGNYKQKKNTNTAL